MGLDPTAFWALTPRVYAAHMAGAQRRERRLDERATTAAWLGARLARAKAIPKIEQLLGRRAAPAGGGAAAGLAVLRQRLPAITMDEWRARHG